MPNIWVFFPMQRILFVMCAGNELFYSALYLMHFTPGPVGEFTKKTKTQIYENRLINLRAHLFHLVDFVHIIDSSNSSLSWYEHVYFSCHESNLGYVFIMFIVKIHINMYILISDKSESEHCGKWGILYWKFFLYTVEFLYYDHHLDWDQKCWKFSHIWLNINIFKSSPFNKVEGTTIMTSL